MSKHCLFIQIWMESVLFNCVSKSRFHLAMEVLGQAFSGAPSLSDRRECDLLWFSILHRVRATHRWSDSSSFQHKSQWIRSEELHKFRILQELLTIVDILQLAWWSKGKTWKNGPCGSSSASHMPNYSFRHSQQTKQSKPFHRAAPCQAFSNKVSTELGQLAANCCVLPSAAKFHAPLLGQGHETLSNFSRFHLPHHRSPNF